jgi:ribosomal protein L11 methyltransferase
VRYPAVDVRSESTDLVAAIVDDFSPTAIEERSDAVRIFFPTPQSRDAASAALARLEYETTIIDVDDEDWAKRSQASLGPVTVGRLTIAPPWANSPPGRDPHAVGDGDVITILPSTGFGTGHHATTRLCLEALQAIELGGRSVLDVGTGSGVLALAADRLGAARAIGIDNDPDAIRSALENLSLNPRARQVAFETADLATGALPVANVLTANLTAGLLIREAPCLVAAVASGGYLIVSGVLAEEGPEVRRCFGALTLWLERAEEGWICLMMKKL